MKAYYLASAGISLTLLASNPAFGQVAGQPEASEEKSSGQEQIFDEIVVTAQKRSESTQDVPLSIAAFSGDALNKLGANDVVGIAALVPGFTVAQSFRGPPIYTLRGVGFNTPNLSASSPVGIYVDEIAYPYPVMTSGLAFDLERVEVLKGPQGTLYGRNTTGGLVNYIAHKPDSNNEGYLKLSAGNYSSYGMEGVINAVLTDTVAVRLATKLDKSDKGWQKSITRGDRRGEIDRFSARLGIQWQVTPDVDINLTGTWWKDKSESTVGQTVEVYPRGFGGDINSPVWAAGLNALGLSREFILGQAFKPTKASQANWVATDIDWGGTVGGQNYTKPRLDAQKDNELWSLASRIEWRLNDALSVTSLTSYADYQGYQPIDVAGWEVENALGVGTGSIKSFQQELRLAGKFDRGNFIAGGFYGHDKISILDRNWGATVSSLSSLLRPIGASYIAATGGSLAAQEDALWGFRDWENYVNQDIKTWSLFAQGDYPLADRLTLTMGLRYTSDRVDSSGCSRDQGDNSIAATWNAFFPAIGIPANVAPGGCVTYLGDIQAPFLSRLDNDPTNDLPFPLQGVVNQRLKEDNLAGRLAVNFKINSDFLVYASATRGFKSGAVPTVDANVASQLDPVKQEEVRAYEIGLKSSPAAGTVFNLAGFYYDYRNKQVFGAVPDIVYGFLTRLVNVPKSRILGAEFEVSHRVAQGLNVRLAGTYLDSKIDEYTGFDQVGNIHVFDGASFTFTPKFQLNGSASYDFPVSQNLHSQIVISGRYSSSQKADFPDTPRFHIDPYVVFDANWSLATVDDKYELELFARNLFNKYYWTSVQTDQDSIVRFAGMPRTYGISVSVRF
jgi:outer membrane receptor protein involved in Fe transport